MNVAFSPDDEKNGDTALIYINVARRRATYKYCVGFNIALTAEPGISVARRAF